jgi:glutamyl-Q tRNA(Asp) synthetase
MQADAEPVRQSARSALYDAAIERLAQRHRIYRCACSRKTVAAISRAGIEGPVYPGTCWRQPPPRGRASALRVRVEGETQAFVDRIFGPMAQDLASEVGDFVVRRLDGFTAYQLAVVVDDAEQGITDVVRGADLLLSTPRQLWLQHLLGHAHPTYAHVPLALDSQGRKLSKRDAAHPVDDHRPLPAMLAAWQHLGQMPPPPGLDTPAAFWRWATPRWHIERVPARPPTMSNPKP